MKSRNLRSAWLLGTLPLSLCVCLGTLTSERHLDILNSSVAADTSFEHRPRSVRVAQLSVGRKDFIFFERDDGERGSITAVAPGGELIFTIPPDSTQPINELLDVTDLDGDGRSEIIGIYRGSPDDPDVGRRPPALWIYNSKGTLRTRYSFTSPSRLTLSHLSVKIYPAGSQKRIVVAPDTFYITPDETSSHSAVYFFNGNGEVLSAVNIPANCLRPCGGEILTFPSVLVGNIDNSGGLEVVVVAKSRFVIFSEGGEKLSCKQFVQPGAPCDRYLVDADPAQGRRYGMQQLIDIDGDGDLELILAADANPVAIAPGLYEAYKIGGALRGDGAIQPMWRVQIPGSNRDFRSIRGTLPNSNYQVGVPRNGVDDINRDGRVDLVLTESRRKGRVFVRMIDAITGSVNDCIDDATGSPLKGICLDVRFLDNSQQIKFRDLLIFDPEAGVHSLWRPVGRGSFRFRQLPGTMIPANDAVILFQSIPVRISASDPGLIRTGEAVPHFAAMLTKADGVRYFLGYSPADPLDPSKPGYCRDSGSGLGSWTTFGGMVKQGVEVKSRPGQVMNVLDVNDGDNSVWVVILEQECGVLTDRVRTMVQSGGNLIANGDL